MCLGREECPLLVQLLDGREVDVRDREGELDKARWGVAGTGQLPSLGGRGFDWTRPGGYSYRDCSASSVLGGRD